MEIHPSPFIEDDCLFVVIDEAIFTKIGFYPFRPFCISLCELEFSNATETNDLNIFIGSFTNTIAIQANRLTSASVDEVIGANDVGFTSA